MRTRLAVVPTIRPIVERHSAAWHLARLEGSDLYRRRELAAREAQQFARLRALWYLSPDCRSRYEWEA